MLVLECWKLILRAFSDFPRKLDPTKITRHTVCSMHTVLAGHIAQQPFCIGKLPGIYQRGMDDNRSLMRGDHGQTK